MAKMPDTIHFDIRVHGVPAGYKLVPIEPPDALAPHLTGYSLGDNGMSERDRAILAAIDGDGVTLTGKEQSNG